MSIRGYEDDWGGSKVGEAGGCCRSLKKFSLREIYRQGFNTAIVLSRLSKFKTTNSYTESTQRRSRLSIFKVSVRMKRRGAVAKLPIQIQAHPEQRRRTGATHRLELRSQINL